jgi:UDP-N-acetylmuramoyl-tripeptide--D-alanyl-D-alanine ligase
LLNLADVFEALTNNRPGLMMPIITEAVIDSRQVIPGCLFIAIQGEHVDGHDFIQDVFRQGASFALIEHDITNPFPCIDLRKEAGLNLVSLPEGPICLRVENTLSALHKIAHFWRRKLDIRVVGVTGSVGKSTTKELISEVLSTRYRTLKNPGNMNNEIGLPLTVLKLSSSYERAVLEMGFYVPGEIAFLCDIAQPQVGVVTNIGTVHAERAGSQQAIAEGKSELVQALPPSPDGVAILNYDDPLVKAMAQKTKARIFFYGLNPLADLWADEIESLGLEGIQFRLNYHNEILHIKVPLIGQHSVHTALRAAAVGLVEGLTWQEIIEGLTSNSAQLRLMAVRSESGALLLDDTYNASPESSLSALNLLADLDGRKLAVLGDMLELGQYEKQGHEMVGVRAAQVSEFLVTVGQRSHITAEAARRAGMKTSHIYEFENPGEATQFLKGFLTSKDTVLIKGSRGIQMDLIVTALEVPE